MRLAAERPQVEIEQLAAVVMHDVEENLEEPGAAIGSRLETIKRAPRLHEGLLRKVFGVCAIAADAPGCAQDGIEVRQRFGGKSVFSRRGVCGYSRWVIGMNSCDA